MIKQKGVSSLFLGLLGTEERGLDLSNAVLSLSSRDACPVPSFLVNRFLDLGLWSWIGANGGMGLGVHLLAVNLDLALVERFQAELVKDAAANQQTSAISSGVVGQANGDTIA